MFGLFKKKECNIYAPVNGKMIDISEVLDPVFSKKLMGDGVGFIFDGDTLYSPIDGKIKLIADTKHAIGFEACNKAEVLMHIGLDTVALKGEGFEVLVNEGDKVKHGTPLIKINRKLMKEKNIDLTTPIVITNPEYSVQIENLENVTVGTIVMKCSEN
ncbi:PTS glucose transporter subunit IIA [Catenibacterium sp. AM22-15]|uniref:PTS sugar transporter subunit IIA n=1 Tax=unclassified Catenibacterium TaxID=2643636 RepID=UPI000E3F2202|nr:MULTISPECIES: PTS glucose transporter subunit IIA [unclassified Catenibacterium]RGE97640.1 PTS glucose transporter subunit IIA [Catenibacterium sp. AM22-6LB]RGF06274.1 PTS glucose transporter subunit IIA [Catenibacterium sp. AM22-15]